MTEPTDPPQLERIAIAEYFEVGTEVMRRGVLEFRRVRDLVHRSEAWLVSLAKGSDGADARARFAADGARLRGVRSKHLLVPDRVVDDGGKPYWIVTPSREVGSAGGLEGATLRERLVRAPEMTDAELLQLARSLTSALQGAMERGLHHGVIDPDYVLVGAGGYRLFGFGLASTRASDSPPPSGQSSGPSSGPSSGASRGWLKKRGRPDHGEARDVADVVAVLVAAAGDAMPPWLASLLEQTTVESVSPRLSTLHALSQALDRVAIGDAPADRPAAARSDEETTPGDPDSPLPSSPPLPDAGSDSSDGSSPGVDPTFPWRPLPRYYTLSGEPRLGGMGELWEAIEISTGRRVAIKRLRPHRLGSERARRRFRREARSMAALDHPHVLRLLDVGRDHDGDYLVFEWAARGSLHDVLEQRGKLPMREVLVIAKQIGGALDYAHGKGHVHRDVKPHNILLLEDGQPKLGDFGLVMLEGDTGLTIPGGRPGTPNYMPPEQGSPGGVVDARSDLYALAKTLYHLLTGEKPLVVELRRVPWTMRGPLARALREDPAKRHRSVGAFVRSLEARDAWLSRARVALLVLVPAAALIAGLSIFFPLGDDPPREPHPRTTSAPTTPIDPVHSGNAGEPPAPPDLVEPLGLPEPIVPLDPLAKARAELVAMRARLRDPAAELRALSRNDSAIDADERTPRVFKRLDEADAAESAAARAERAGDAARAQSEVGRATAALIEVELLMTALRETAAVNARSVVDVAGGLDWDAALRIAGDAKQSRYLDTALTRQVGLTPLRLDPDTRHLEFLVDGSGEVPAYGIDGRAVVVPATGIVVVLLPTTASLPAFFIAKFELTQAQFQRLSASDPSQFAPSRSPPGASIDATHPVENVTAEEARRALATVALRLPTEAEWETAHRGGTNWPFWTGPTASTLRGRENAADVPELLARVMRGAPPPPRLEDGYWIHAPVGRLAANAYGLFDVAGNVSELCKAADPAATESAAANGPTAIAVARGGSFADALDDCRADRRVELDAGSRRATIGIRAARSLD